MYAHSDNNNNNTASPLLLISELELDTLPQLHTNNNSCSSGYSSPNSLPSPSSFMQLQRSVSSHSLHHNHHATFTNATATNHPFSAFFAELLDSYHAPVRRASSTGDLQRINGMQHGNYSESPLSSESSMIIEGMSRACRYSPEEKKLRIERYRTKRNQRNFNKKIKYACRKTLADSRPRIRGRFARNDEIEKNTAAQWSRISGGEEEDEEDESWISILDSLVAANLAHETQGCSSFGFFY